MRRVTVAAVAVACLAAAGCADSPVVPASQAVCVSDVTATHIRVDDARCAGTSSAYAWWYLAAGQLAPRIGQRVSAGSLTRPAGPVRSGLPATPTRTTPRATPTKQKSTPTVRTQKPAAPKPKPAAPTVRTR